MNDPSPALTQYAHPLRRLFAYAPGYRADVTLATIYSTLNKFFDVLPEILIGVAVDVVVSRKDSFIAKFGTAPVRSHHQHLVLIVIE